MKYRFARTRSSKFRGVSYNPHADKFEARISVQKVHYFLGLFYDDISAAIVYDSFAVRLGVSHRSNGAYHQHRNELPIIQFSPPEPCAVCNGAKVITSKKISNGDWIDSIPIPCPLCQTQPQDVS